MEWIHLRPYTVPLENVTYDNVLYLIDLLSVWSGIFTERALLFECYEMLEKEYPDHFFREFLYFLQLLARDTRKYGKTPYFVVFYDWGQCKQNIDIFPDYKQARREWDEWDEVRRNLKRYYLSQLESRFGHIKNLQIIDMQEYESDFIGWYLRHPDMYNIILSNDKDLMQALDWDNCINIRRIKSKQLIHDKTNFYTRFGNKMPKFDPKYVPLLLALAGDASDSIPGVKKGLGLRRALELIRNYKLPTSPFEFTESTEFMLERKGIDCTRLKLNYQLISFEEQVKRIPESKLPKLTCV